MIDHLFDDRGNDLDEREKVQFALEVLDEVCVQLDEAVVVLEIGFL